MHISLDPEQPIENLLNQDAYITDLDNANATFEIFGIGKFSMTIEGGLPHNAFLFLLERKENRTAFQLIAENHPEKGPGITIWEMDYD